MAFDTTQTDNVFTLRQMEVDLGSSLRLARRTARLTQAQLSAAAEIDLATVRALERGSGTIRPLIAVLNVLTAGFTEQPMKLELGAWIAASRKAAGHSQAAMAAAAGMSKPTIVQIEQGNGQVRSLLKVFAILRVAPCVIRRSSGIGAPRLIHGDCLEVMPSLPDGSVHAIIADLPYCQTARKRDPLWAPKRDPFFTVFERRGA